MNDEVTAAAPPPPLLSPLLDPDEADLSTVGGYSADEENTLCAIEAGAAAPVYSRETSTSRLCPPAQKAAALFLLTFQERFKLSQSAINFAVGSINTIVDSVCKSVQSSVEGEVSATRLTESFDEREDPFAPLKTIHAVQVLSRALWIGCKLYTRKSAATLLHDTLLEKSLRVRNSNYIIPECCW